MQKAYVIIESVGHSIYEEHTIPFVYMKKEWAEYQKGILEDDKESSLGVKFIIREVTIVTEGPK